MDDEYIWGKATDNITIDKEFIYCPDEIYATCNFTYEEEDKFKTFMEAFE